MKPSLKTIRRFADGQQTVILAPMDARCYGGFGKLAGFQTVT